MPVTLDAAAIRFVPDLRRQAIVDTWPEDVDDSRARADWGFEPEYTTKEAWMSHVVSRKLRRYR